MKNNNDASKNNININKFSYIKCIAKSEKLYNEV